MIVVTLLQALKVSDLDGQTDQVMVKEITVTGSLFILLALVMDAMQTIVKTEKHQENAETCGMQIEIDITMESGSEIQMVAAIPQEMKTE